MNAVELTPQQVATIRHKGGPTFRTLRGGYCRINQLPEAGRFKTTQIPAIQAQVYPRPGNPSKAKPAPRPKKARSASIKPRRREQEPTLRTAIIDWFGDVSCPHCSSLHIGGHHDGVRAGVMSCRSCGRRFIAKMK